MIYVLTVIYENSELKLFDSATEKFRDKDKAFKRFNELIDKCKEIEGITVEKDIREEDGGLYVCISEEGTKVEVGMNKLDLYNF